MRWSKLKQRVEDRMADSLQRRVEIHTARYRKADDSNGRLWFTVDKREVASMCDFRYRISHYEFANAIRVATGATDYHDPKQRAIYYSAEKQADVAMHEQGVFSRWQSNHILWDYLSLSIDVALQSDNVLVRALVMLDRRLGKRRLRTLQLGDDEHPLVRQFYDLRCEAEGIRARTAPV